jgi:lipopolysaccharide export system permease protein
MSLKDLRRQLKQFTYLGTQGMLVSLRIEIQKKLAESFNHVFLILGALPFALKIRRRHVNFSLMGLAIMFGLCYYVIFSISTALGKTGIFSPELSAWIANIFFGISGIVGLADLR